MRMEAAKRIMMDMRISKATVRPSLLEPSSRRVRSAAAIVDDICLFCGRTWSVWIWWSGMEEGLMGREDLVTGGRSKS